MKTKYLISYLTLTLTLAIVGTFIIWTDARADADAGTGSTSRVNVKALAAKLEFLGDKPVLTGHPLLIEFWATWCPPCRASIAHLNEVNKSYHERGLQIVGITSEDKAVVESFRARVAMDYSVALDPDQALASEFQVQTIPHAWLLDKNGRVVWSGHPAELDEHILDRALLPNPPAT